LESPVSGILAIQVGELPTDLGRLIGVESNLTGFSARIVYIQDPLMMTLPTGACSAGNARRVKRMTFEQGAAQQVVDGWELGDELASALLPLVTSV
jgi:hypothetical protein